MGNADPLGTLVLLLAFVNLGYVGAHLWRDARAGRKGFALAGIGAALASLAGLAFFGFLWWLDYTDFRIGS